MGRATYWVVRHNGQWRFGLYGLYSGGFPTEEAAVDAAITAATKPGVSGQIADVRVQPSGRAARLVWSREGGKVAPPVLTATAA